MIGDITGDYMLEMSWKNYNSDIVDEYRAVLKGWPHQTFDPAKLGLKALVLILKALKSRDCEWNKLTEEEFKDRKELLATGSPILMDNTNK